MRARLVLGLTATLLAGAAARTGDAPRPGDMAIIRACLGTNKMPAERRPCIGRVATPCQTPPEGQTTVGMIECFARETEVWDALLNETFRHASTSFDASGKAYLRDAQTTWIRFRDQSCAWPEKVYPGGTIIGPLRQECVMEETAARTLTLMEIDESLNPG